MKVEMVLRLDELKEIHDGVGGRVCGRGWEGAGVGRPSCATERRATVPPAGSFRVCWAANRPSGERGTPGWRVSATPSRLDTRRGSPMDAVPFSSTLDNQESAELKG